jgi:replication factor C subunit 2/4
MNQNYIVKYAPQKLGEVHGNYGTIQTLMSMVESRNIPNLIITGPHGSGKSTIVKLLIEEYLGVENMADGCLKIYGSLDRGKDVVSEVNKAAKSKSNNFNYSNVRSFIRKATNLPNGFLKIILIFEFHQMSTEAQMALRRIMELNSEKARFIFVTQNYGKIINALQSRCNILKLSPIEDEEIEKVLEKICLAEEITPHQEMFDLIKLTADGDIRMAVNLLQVLSKCRGDQDRLAKYYKILGIPEIETMIEVLENCRKDGDIQKSYLCVQKLLYQGFEICDLLNILTKVLICLESFPEKNKYLEILAKFTLKIQECYTSTQLYNLLNHLSMV